MCEALEALLEGREGQWSARLRTVNKTINFSSNRKAITLEVWTASGWFSGASRTGAKTIQVNPYVETFMPGLKQSLRELAAPKGYKLRPFTIG